MCKALKMAYENQKKKLDKLFAEADSSESFSGIDSDSSDPFADDGEYSGKDPNYIPERQSSDTFSISSKEEEFVEPSEETAVNGGEVNLDKNEKSVENADEDNWTSDTESIPDFQFDKSRTGIQISLNENPSPVEVFSKLWTPDIVSTFVECTNKYGQALFQNLGKRTRNSRYKSFEETNETEIGNFFALCLLHFVLLYFGFYKFYIFFFLLYETEF